MTSIVVIVTLAFLVMCLYIMWLCQDIGKVLRILERKLSACPSCKGTGVAGALCCGRCGGSGTVDPYTGKGTTS